MAYEIRIKGRREPLIIEKNADRLKADWDSYVYTKVDAPVQTANWSGRLSLIQDFMRVNDSQADKPSSSDAIHAEYLKDRKEILNLSLEDRASRMGFFRLIYKGFTGKNSEEVLVKETPIEELAKKIQLDFFIKNPKRIHCDVECFKPLIKSTVCNKMVVPLIESIIRQEYFAANNL
jgi:hypothetical protein